MTSEPNSPGGKPREKEPDQRTEVTFEEFQKLDIRLARVLEVSRVPNSQRLLKLQLQIGDQRKQCIAGIGAKYEPEHLKDKLIVVLTNMKPRQIMGLVSEVMLLAAADGPEISVLTPEKTQMSSGAKVT